MYKYTFGNLQVYCPTHFKYFELILQNSMVIIDRMNSYAARSWGQKLFTRLFREETFTGL